MNGLIAKKHQKIKIDNETLIKLTNDLYKVEVELNSTKRILEECTRSNPPFTQTRLKSISAKTSPIMWVASTTTSTCRKSKGVWNREDTSSTSWNPTLSKAKNWERTSHSFRRNWKRQNAPLRKRKFSIMRPTVVENVDLIFSSNVHTIMLSNCNKM